MKHLSLRWSLAQDALRPLISVFLLLTAATLAVLAYVHPQGLLFIVVILGLGMFGAAIVTLSPGNLLVFYFTYLMFEGGLKIISNYNIAIRFGSDLLLGLAFLRLMSRYAREGNQGLTPEVRKRFGTLVGFFTMFWIWVAVQFLNPWGLGLLPSIAGLKVYLIPLLVFFAVGIFLKDEELRLVPFVLLGMGVLQSVISVVDWLIGPTGLPMMHPKYAQVLWDFLQGFPYRPFGTTNLPGAPALWMFHCMTGALLALAQLQGARNRYIKVWKTAFWIFVVFGFMTIIACQVRLSLLRFLFVLVAGLFILNRKSAVIFSSIVVGGLALVLSTSSVSYQDALSKRSFVKIEDRLTLAIARLATLKSVKEVAAARGGSWAIEEFKERANVTTAGIGLSRIGAAAAPWVNLIEEDPHFDLSWAFADNLALALFTELGAGGLAGYVILVIAVLYSLIAVNSAQSQIAACACGLLFLSAWGSEGVLFQPDASLFWMTAAIGLRSPPKEGAIL